MKAFNVLMSVCALWHVCAMGNSELTARGRAVRAVFVPPSKIRMEGVEAVARELKARGLNGIITDLKNESGHVSFPTRVPAFRNSVTLGGEGDFPDLHATVQALKAEGLYVILRTVCFKDPILGRERERVVLWKNGRPWSGSRHEPSWLNPYYRPNQRDLIALALEGEAAGADEIQFDYIRFHGHHSSPRVWIREHAGLWGGVVPETRADVLARFLEDADRALHIPIGVDIFGISVRTHALNQLGQNPERWTEHVEVFSPMLYLNNMRGWSQGVARRAEVLIEGLVRLLMTRIGADSIVRPYLQAFPNGADGYRGRLSVMMREQIDGARNAGAQGFQFWNASGNYRLLSSEFFR